MKIKQITKPAVDPARAAIDVRQYSTTAALLRRADSLRAASSGALPPLTAAPGEPPGVVIPEVALRFPLGMI